MKHDSFDVIVIGGGHAGTEAASASARMGARTALVTLRRDDLGVMSCNPAIGGLGKGHIVREVDAFDGVMGRAADAAGIQFRLLNRKKGPAVRGPRAQCDRALYRSAVARLVESIPGLSVIEGEVVDLMEDAGRIVGVRLADGSSMPARAVVLTSGTFLRGVIHIGEVSYGGGRMGANAVNHLADRVRSMGLTMGRLKTGTPPRLDGRTIDWSSLEKQPGDDDPSFFSSLTSELAAEQVSCGIAHTNPRTHEIIASNLGRSAMYAGRIEGTGPRYCPSIEDKVTRFAGKESHQVFLEPEGLDTPTVYPNGISTSLPEEVQYQYVRSMRGLEDVDILRPGYAIEYDYVDPRALRRTLELRDQPGLFLAGQINGTTGYEEAAGQGLVAGLNAAASALDRDAVRFDRKSSYIGVMIDDLTTSGVTEPYRMFTSRAEYRLSLRADNADQRLTPMGEALGVVSDTRRTLFHQRMEAVAGVQRELSQISLSARSLADVGLRIAPQGKPRTALDALSLPGGTVDALISLVPELGQMDAKALEQVANDALYAHYLRRQERDVSRLAQDEALRIPDDLDFAAIDGLSNELRAKLEATRPETIGQAGRIDGMTPAALTLILAWMRRREKLSA
ncbi:MAG: tRNA uridine-5-carboxymethylaminomethyl(34) synthesis enzyme MnmG [Pseudomonadota bacterium]